MKKLLLMIIFLTGCCLLSKETSAYCNHVWVEDTSMYRAPTCKQEGVRWYDCKECYDSKTETIPANTGVHNWSEWEADGELCKSGKWTRHCKDCYLEETKIREGDGSHLWSEWEISDDPDCLNEGEKYRKCYKCYEYEYEEIPSSSKKHSWSSWSWLYSKNGGTGRKCYTCGKVQNVNLNIYKKTMRTNKSFVLKIKKRAYGDKVVKFQSSNKKVAVVNKKGKVVAKKRGNATITVKMKSGCKAKCKITVK